MFHSPCHIQQARENAAFVLNVRLKFSLVEL